MKFYRIDDQIVISDKDLSAGTLLTANTADASQEKHVPQISVDGGTVKVKVGSAEHPSFEEHYIEWILLETTIGFQIRYLKPGMKPEAAFALTEGETVLGAYEYCNLHGLGKGVA